MVSVGTFRALIIYAWALYITHLWMTDIDKGAVDFNRAHLDLIQCIVRQKDWTSSMQRLRYIANLHGYDFLAPPVLDMHGKSSVAIIREMLDKKDPRLIHVDNIDDASNCLKMAHLAKGMKNVFFKNNTRQSIQKGNLFDFVHNSEIERYYWEDDQQWEKIVHGIFENRIAISQSTITTEKSSGLYDLDKLSQLANFVKGSNLNFGLFDVSNVSMLHDNMGKTAWGIALNRLNIRPYRFFFTSSPALTKHTSLEVTNSGDNWSYYSLPSSDFHTYLIEQAISVPESTVMRDTFFENNFVQ